MHKLLNLILVVLITSFTIGCSSVSKQMNTTKLSCTDVTTNSVTCERFSKILKALSKQGVDIFCVKNSLILVVAADKMFVKNSANFNYNTHKIIALLNKIIELQPDVVLMVSGHRSGINNVKDKGLILERSKKIAGSLWNAGSNLNISCDQMTFAGSEILGIGINKNDFLVIKFVDFYK